MKTTSDGTGREAASARMPSREAVPLPCNFAFESIQYAEGILAAALSAVSAGPLAVLIDVSSSATLRARRNFIEQDSMRGKGGVR